MADENTTTTIDTTASTQDATKVDAPQEKSYTQSELDNLIQKRLEHERSKFPSNEDIDAFNKWKEDQKTTEQKKADDLVAEKQRADLAIRELTKYKQFESIRKFNVDESYLGYINYEVSELAKSKNIHFDEALTRFMKDKAEKYARQDTRTISADIGSKDNGETPKAPMSFKFMGVRPQK